MLYGYWEFADTHGFEAFNLLKFLLPTLTNSPIRLKKTLRTPRRRRLNLSEGHPMFVICNL
jgi:hypothetical protein